MSNDNIVSVGGTRFRVQDITFKGARKQSEILNEIEVEEKEKQVVQAPTSCTPEQVKTYLSDLAKVSEDNAQKRVLLSACKMIEELMRSKDELRYLRNKVETLTALDDDTPDDIEE